MKVVNALVYSFLKGKKNTIRRTKQVLLSFKVYIRKGIFAIIFVLPSLQKEDLVIKDYQYTQENIRKVELELFSKTDNTTFHLKIYEKMLLL